MPGIISAESAENKNALYIYEQAGWPNFEYEAEAIAEPLAQLRFEQGRLIGSMEALGFKLRQETDLQTISQDVIKTSEIEGEILDSDEVRSSVARRLGLDMAGLKPSGRAVDGVVAMLVDATKNSSAPLSEARLFGWHAALFPTGYSGMFQIKVGAYRDGSAGPMQVVSGAIGHEKVHFQAPEADRVPTEMKKFLRWFEGTQGNEGSSNLDPILKSAIAHFWLVTIHPFEDGNGRIARAVADMVLARADQVAERFYSMSSQIRVECKTYYDILEKTQKQSKSLDITGWLTWYLACLGRAIANAQQVRQSAVRKARVFDKISQISTNDRQNKVINKLLSEFEGKFTSSKWAMLAGCSQDTAHRDIADLVDKGVLQKDEGGGRSTSYSLLE